MADEPPTQSSSSDGDEVRVDGRTAAEWKAMESEDRAKAIEKLYWFWHAKKYPPEDPYKQFDKPPIKRWYLDEPAIQKLGYSGDLCEVCQHINFKYLMDCLLDQIVEEIELATLEWIVDHERCAFCRLVALTLRDAVSPRKLETHVGEKAVVCTIQILPMDTDTSKREILVVTHPSPEGINNYKRSSFYQFVSSDVPSYDADISDRCIQTPRINYDLVRKWCQDCASGGCGEAFDSISDAEQPKGFRVIDVERYCVVDHEPGLPYVALSYVWGFGKQLQNNTKIRKSLEQPEALLKKIGQLPNIIRDAIILTREIGERYLWVDSLCIIQDDPSDKASQIGAMDRIYSNAMLTIAATSGNRVDAGLAGMSAGPRTFKQHVSRVQGTLLANRVPRFSAAVDDSIWNTRAWTLQERVMSRRVVFVGEHRCFFTCHHRQSFYTEGEDVILNGLQRSANAAPFKDLANLIPSSKSVNVVVYHNLVRTYTLRQLRMPSDMVKALEGLTARVRPLFRSDFLFCMPRSEMESQLLWQPSGSVSRRRDPDTGLPLFPSWSWAGWVGEVSCSTAESLSRIEWIENDGTRFSGRDYRYPAATRNNTMEALMYRWDWESALENEVPYYWEKRNPDHWFLHPTAPEGERIVGPNLKSGTYHLVFEAEASEYFKLGGHFRTFAIRDLACTEDAHTVCPIVFRDPDDYVAGYAMVPAELATKMNAEALYNVVRISRGKLFEQKDWGEGNPDLLDDSEAITMVKTHFPDRPNIETAPELRCFDQQRYDSTKSWCIYNVMLVEWVGDVAYRLGVGAVHIDAWAQAKPQTTIVTLG